MYKLTNTAIIVRTTDGACFLPAPQNTDYAAYRQWLSEGNTPTPADPILEPTPVPTLVEQILASPKDLAALKQALGL